MIETLISNFTVSTSSFNFLQVLLTIGMTFICGGIISFTYRKTSDQGKYSDNFGLTIILLPAVIGIIIMLIGSDIARAFSLAGAFSIIRFRSAPGEPRDIAYVLFAMAAGLAGGVGAYVYALLFTIILCAVMYLLAVTHFKKLSTPVKQLMITIPEDLDYEHALNDVFETYTSGYELKRIKTTALGSLYQLYYDVELKQNTSTKAFLDDLRCRNSNLNISLMQITDRD